MPSILILNAKEENALLRCMRKYNPATLPAATVLLLILRSSWEVNGFGILGIFMMDKTAKLSSLPILSIILSIIPAPASQESSQTSKNDFCGYRIVFKGKNNKKTERVRTARFYLLAPLPGLEPRSNP